MSEAARLRFEDGVAALDLVAYHGLSLRVRAGAGPVRDALIARLGADVLRITADSDAATLAGEVDLLASLATGARIERAGLAERTGARVLLVAGAERVGGALAVTIAELIEAGRGGVVLLDESAGDDPFPPMLGDRVAMTVDLDPVSVRDIGVDGQGVVPAAAVHPPIAIAIDDETIAMICEAAAALAIESPRIPIAAVRVLRALAGRAGRAAPDDADCARVARIVLAPQARALPTDRPDAPPPDCEETPETDAGEGEDGAPDDRDILLDAAMVALPAGLLAPGGGKGRGAGSATARRGPGARGRGGRVLKALPVRGARLDLAATLIAAAPFQRLRGRDGGRLAVRRDDIRVRRPVPVQRAATIFAVDASGSSALARLAEVKGAVERLLAESYVRRDEVALVAFRGTGAETLLPPTRSLARARRELSALPGGGGTPLAAGIVAGLEQAVRSRAAGRAPMLVLLTDGGANVARDGSPGRAAARADAETAALMVASAGVAALVVDSSPRGDAGVRAVAAAMGARYVALPRLDDRALGAIVGAARA